MSGFFVRQASQEMEQAPCIATGQPEADLLLQRARRAIYHWPADFAGFVCQLSLQEGGRTLEGPLSCRGSRRIVWEGPALEAPEDARWLGYQLEELVSHREAPEVSRISSKSGCQLGDWDETYGRRVDFLGDRMESYYRLKDDRIQQIGRSSKNEVFLVTIDFHQNCEGRWAAQSYSVHYWSREDGSLLRSENYFDNLLPVHGVFLPAERRVTVASAAGYRARRLLFEQIRLL